MSSNGWTMWTNLLSMPSCDSLSPPQQRPCCHLLLQASNAASVERQQLAQLEVQVAGLVGVLRQLLVSTDSSGSGLMLPESPTRTGTPAIKVLSDLVDLVAAELSHKLRG